MGRYCFTVATGETTRDGFVIIGAIMRQDVLRTPDERFAGLEDFPFQPHYVELDAYRVHYLEEGPADAAPVLLLHGEPSWCYLYRKMIPVLAAAGHRCIAPDLVGFGRSDKPVRRETYTYQFHVDLMNAFVREKGLRNIRLFCQDWGGLIGLRVLADNPDLFSRLVVANTGLPTGDHKVSEGFLKWLHYSQTVENFHVGGILKGGCVSPLSPGAVAAYNAPFPTDEFKAGARQFPVLVPITPDNPASEANRGAWEVLRRWPGKVLTLFSDKDPVMAGGEKPFQKLMPGAAGQPHETITAAGHFLQEDKGEEIAAKVVAWMASSPD
jgi:haloalkane dehalogenase